jgi:hypothetical protein
MGPDDKNGAQNRRINPTVVALIGGLALVLLVAIAVFASRQDPDQDKLSDAEVNLTQPGSMTADKRCSNKSTYDLLKRELFRLAAQARGSAQAAYGEVGAAAVVRMENAVLESEDGASGAVNCSASLSLDLPPGIAVSGGRRTLTADIDYTIDRGGNVVLRNADAIVAPLTTLARVAEPPPMVPETNAMVGEAPEENAAAPESPPPGGYPGRPGFDCTRAQTNGEIAVCSDSSLSALDLNMTTQYRRALGSASPQQHQLLQSTRNRFLAYRDRCSTRQCIADAYAGRMREIRDIMEGRWQPR